jgi:hypothetical protein
MLLPVSNDHSYERTTLTYENSYILCNKCKILAKIFVIIHV